MLLYLLLVIVEFFFIIVLITIFMMLITMAVQYVAAWLTMPPACNAASMSGARKRVAGLRLCDDHMPASLARPTCGHQREAFTGLPRSARSCRESRVRLRDSTMPDLLMSASRPSGPPGLVSPVSPPRAEAPLLEQANTFGS